MTQINKITFGFLLGLVIWGLIAFIVVSSIPEYVAPQYTQADSLRNVAIDSVKGEYQQVIDSLRKVKPIIRLRTKELKKIADSLSVNADSVCAPVIAAKDSVIEEQQKEIELLDFEARTYSDLCMIEREKTSMEIKRFNALSLKTDSIILNYKDSLTAQRKYYKKRVLWYKFTTTISAALGIYGIIR